MRQSDSGQANGTSGSPQTTFEQQTLKQKSKENEERAKRDDYLRNKLPKSCPLNIPKSAVVSDQKKNGYEQVRYVWKVGEFTYTARWHTRTPNAPAGQGATWVVERKRAGQGSGPNPRRREEHILVGRYKWVSKKKWYDAIAARKAGTATKKQEELLNNGHWKAER